jgi:outer membrane lipoprotein carrier protein
MYPPEPGVTGARRLGALFALVFALVLALVPGAGALGAAADTAQRLDDYLKGLNSLESTFTQITFNADRTRMIEARGTFYLQRPGRFRWQYDTPNKQVIIADGKRVYIHDLDLNQVSHESQERALRGTPALLLADDEPIERQFTTKPVDSTDGRDWLELTPKATDSDIAKIELGFGKTGIESMIMEDSFGQTTRLNFSDIKRNPRLDAGLFKVDEKAVNDFLSFD